MLNTSYCLTLCFTLPPFKPHSHEKYKPDNKQELKESISRDICVKVQNNEAGILLKPNGAALHRNCWPNK